MANPIPNKAIVNWVTKRRTSMSEDAELVTRFELWHAVDGELAERLGLYEMDTRDEDEDPEDLVQEIWNDAVEDSGTRPQGSYQRYAIKAFRGDGHEPDESKAFTLTGSAVSSAMGGTESPTPRGMMAQDLRMTDNLHGMMMRMAEGTAGQLAQQLREVREENSSLMMQRSKLLDIEQRLLDRSHERQMDRLEREKSGERMDMVMSMVTSLAPILLSKLFEGKGLPGPIAAMMSAGGAPSTSAGGPRPEARGPREDSRSGSGSEPHASGLTPQAADRVRRVMSRDVGIGNLLGTLDADQVRGLAGLLRPDQAMGFMQIYQDYRAEHAEHETKGNQHGNSEETH